MSNKSEGERVVQPEICPKCLQPKHGPYHPACNEIIWPKCGAPHSMPAIYQPCSLPKGHQPADEHLFMPVPVGERVVQEAPTPTKEVKTLTYEQEVHACLCAAEASGRSLIQYFEAQAAKESGEAKRLTKRCIEHEEWKQERIRLLIPQALEKRELAQATLRDSEPGVLREAATPPMIEEFKKAANLLIDYCEAHNWGTMPEPFASINPLLKLLGRDLVDGRLCRNPNHAMTDGSPSRHEIGPSCMAEGVQEAPTLTQLEVAENNHAVSLLEWERCENERDALREQRDEAVRAREHTQDWYARHYGKVEDWARKRLPEPWRTEYFNCVANGTWGHDDVGEPYMSQVGRIVPSGYFKMDSAAEQLLRDQTTRAEIAESRLAQATLREAKEE